MVFNIYDNSFDSVHITVYLSDFINGFTQLGLGLGASQSRVRESRASEFRTA